MTILDLGSTDQFSETGTLLRSALGLAELETPFPWQEELLKRFKTLLDAVAKNGGSLSVDSRLKLRDRQKDIETLSSANTIEPPRPELTLIPPRPFANCPRVSGSGRLWRVRNTNNKRRSNGEAQRIREDCRCGSESWHFTELPSWLNGRREDSHSPRSGQRLPTVQG